MFQITTSWLEGWDYRIELIIDYTKIDSTLPDFPVFLDLSDLSSVFWDNVKDGGGDIRITTSDGITEVPREVVFCDTSVNKGEVHFKGDLSSTVNTIFKIYFGNSGASDYGVTDTYGRNNVWDSNFTFVFHLNQDPSGTAPQMTDSSGCGNHAISSGDMTTSDVVDSNVGKGLDFDGTDDFCYKGANSYTVPTDRMTVESYIKQDIITGNQSVVARGLGTGDRQIGLRLDDGVFDGGMTGPSRKLWVNSYGTFSALTWYYLAATIDIDAEKMYVDQNDTTIVDAALDIASSAAGAYNLEIGRDNRGTSYFNGIIDEVRISTVARSLAWRRATYHSLFNTLLTTRFEHYYYGYITENSVPVSRTVRLYNRNTGVLMSYTTSNSSNGCYHLATTISGEHYVVALDDDDGKDYNALILDRLLPRGTE